MQEKKSIRVLVAKPGLDGHDRGALVLCQVLRDAGMEVIYSGLYQTPESIAKTAIAEDVDVVALSLLDNTHMSSFPRIVKLLKEEKADDVCIVGGGTIPEEDKPELEKIGISGNFGPGTPTKVIVNHIIERVEKREKSKKLQ